VLYAVHYTILKAKIINEKSGRPRNRNKNYIDRYNYVTIVGKNIVHSLTIK
jgi:hypothetical protein